MMRRPAAPPVLLLFVLLGGCQQPLVPRAGVPTLDDAVADDFIAVSAGKAHTCALVSDGSAYCWGSNEAGQLGASTDTATCPREDRRIPCSRTPVRVTGGLGFRQISAGALHTCGLTLNGRVYCWGDNLRGALGDPGVRVSYAPIPILSNDSFVAIAAGGFHTCALRTDGVVFCWGANDDGQLGLGFSGPGSAVPAPVRSSQRFSSIAAGGRGTCARLADGSPYCWGATWVSRQGATEVTRAQDAPARIGQSPPFRTLAVGEVTTCGVTADAAAYCWQANPSGTLGDGSTTGSTTPVAVRFTGGLVSVSVGRSHACAVAATGRAYCWGADNAGQLGVSAATLNTRCVLAAVTCGTVPVVVNGWRSFRDVSAGQGDHTCALALSGSVYCWGAGGMGQLGTGRLSNEWAPARVQRPPGPLL